MQLFCKTNIHLICCSLLLIFSISCKEAQTETTAVAALDMASNSIDKPKATYAVKDIARNEEITSEDILASNAIPDQSKENHQKIIKDGNISIKSKDIIVSKSRFDNALSIFGAYYETEKFEKDDYRISYHLKVRIPADSFDNFIAAVEKGDDEIIEKKIAAQDVTEEYMDIESRLTNKKAYLVKYKDLLAKASTIKDILELEENIRVLQEEIESNEGRLQYLNSQIRLSTLDIYLYQQKPYVFKAEPKDKFFERIKTSLASGWNLIVDFVIWVFGVWPFLIFIIALIIILKRVRKQRKQAV